MADSDRRWQRIDGRPIRNNGSGDCPIPGERRRVYGEHGALWPRLTLSVWPDRQGDESILVVSVGRKECGGAWWSTLRGVPAELATDLVEMIGSFDPVEAGTDG